MRARMGRFQDRSPMFSLLNERRSPTALFACTSCMAANKRTTSMVAATTMMAVVVVMALLRLRGCRTRGQRGKGAGECK